ncbi:hypothetical protein L7F22_057985 [Adiantum nelumboides]|nr:hypothetical protein [Adiantum nelumboides]
MAGSFEKEYYYIKKFDGTNFTIWKQCMMDVFVNKGLAAPLKDSKEGVYNDDQWEELDARARATIQLHLGESIFFTIMGKTTAFELWDSLCLTWDGKSASNKVFLMKKVMHLSMKEGSSVSSHLNEFNALYSQLTSKGLNFDDEMKYIFLLCSLPESWDTFNTAISNSTHGGKLAFGDVTSALLTEKIRRQSLDSGGHGQLDDLGYITVFEKGSWLIRKANLIILKGQKPGTLYSLYVSSVKENVGVVSRYMANPRKKRWDTVKHLLRYLKGTANKCLRFGNSEASIVGYMDADYVGCLDTRKSTCGYVFLFVEAVVSWRSILQTCTSSSMTESKYVVVSSASKEAVWLARLVGDLGIHQIPMLHCDSQSAITLAKNPVFHSKTKHIEVQYHVVRDILATKCIELVKVHTDDNPVDALTKSLASERFTHCNKMMGIG